MGGEVDTYGLGPVRLQATQVLNATRYVARRITADPAALLEVLAALGLPITSQQLETVKARAAIERARKGATVSTATDSPSKAAIADILDKAADVIKTNGHHKGYLYDEAQARTGISLARCRIDAVGAINIAVFGAPRWPSEEHQGSHLAQAAVLAVQEDTGTPLAAWNDGPDRTALDVWDAFRSTAARLRDSGTVDGEAA